MVLIHGANFNDTLFFLFCSTRFNFQEFILANSGFIPGISPNGKYTYRCIF
jgi:hypothetical protein